MRAFFLFLAFVVLLPLTAAAATIDDFNGSWVVDTQRTMLMNKDVSAEEAEQIKGLGLIFDVKKGTVAIRMPGEDLDTETFTVKSQTASSATLELGDGSTLRVDRDGKAGISVGEVGDDGKRKDVLYFKREK